MSDYYIISDQHLATESCPSRDVLIDFCNRLAEIKPAGLIILGDFFHFWFNRPLFTETYFGDVLRSLYRLTEKGIPVHFFIGNHDFFFKSMKNLPSNFLVYAEGTVFELGQRRYYFTHGEDLCRKDWIHLHLFRPFIQSRFLEWLSHGLPVQVLEKIAHGVSATTKKINKVKPERLFKISLPFCEKMVRERHLDGIIHGHIHIDSKRTLNVGEKEAMLLCVAPWRNNSFPVWRYNPDSDQWTQIMADQL